MQAASYFVLLLVVVLVQVLHVSGFANYMTGDSCEVPLEVGEIIMGKKVAQSEEKSVHVYRNDEEIPSGSYYSPGDKLTVKLEPAPVGLQLVLELQNGLRFYGGKCNGKVRTNTFGAVINVTPEEYASAGDEVSILGAWALSYSEGVKIASEKFILRKNPEGVASGSSDL